MRRRSAVQLAVTEVDVAADRVGHHWGNVVASTSYLAEETGVGVTWTCWCVTHHAGSGSTIFHRAAVDLVGVEDLCDAALGRIGHPVLSVPDFVELNMLELSVGGHIFKLKTRGGL